MLPNRTRAFWAGLLLVFGGLAMAEAPPRPPYFAITNARIVTGTGDVIEGGAVLLADGLIERVGIDLPIPGDAWVLDAEGRSLYPGLIDAKTTLGLASEDEDEADDRPIRGPEDRPKTTPWRIPADELVVDSKFESWRKAGFTTVITVPDEGIFAGQATAVNLGEGEPDELIVESSVAQSIQFERGGFRAYPGSLMGVLAYVKQVFEDVDQYRRANEQYDDDPTGRQRSAYDRHLEPLQQALASGMPFLLPGHLPREIDRTLLLSAEYELPAILVGGQGAYARVEALRESRTSVLVSVDWPTAPKDRDPEADTPLRTLIHRRLAKTTPAALASAEIPFAFTGDGVASASDYLEGVRDAIESGLEEDAALAALTIEAARIYGLDDRLGSIERGKIANLVLASDWPWVEEVELKAVVVDGRLYEEPEDDEEYEAPAAEVSGSWSITLQTPGGPREMSLEIEMKEDGKATGSIDSDLGKTPIEGARMSGDLLRFKTTRKMGEQERTASWSLTVEGDRFSGSASVGSVAMDVDGTRTSKPDESDASTEDDEVEEVPVSELVAALAVIQGPVHERRDFAIVNATVWTLAGENIENGTVLVQDGRISAVGTDVSVPSEFELFDARGGHVTPGIIDCHSHMAIEGGVNEGSLAVTSMVGIGDVINPDDIGIYRALAGGVTSANLLHGSANPIGGKNTVVKLRWGEDADGLRFDGAPPGIKFALGENPKRSNWSNPDVPERYPNSRMGVLDVIRESFKDAQEYQREWKAYENDRGKKTPPRRDLEMEALVEILEGERLVHSHCYRADEILQLMRLAEEFGFRIATLQHVLEGYKVADEMAAHGAGGSTFSDWWGYKVEAFEAIPHNAALMSERGVVVSINSDSSEEIRHLNQEAAKAVRWGGMSEIEALKLVTLNPAIQLGIDDRVGSIEVGKDADLVVFDGHPLEIRSIVQHTFVDGQLYFDREADRERQAFIDDLKSRLEGKDGEESDTGSGPEVRWSEDQVYSCREVR